MTITEQKDNLSPSNLWTRLTDEMPAFWKKIQMLMITVGGIGTAIQVAASTMGSQTDGKVIFPAFLLTIAQYMIAIGVTGAAVTSLSSKAKGATYAEDKPVEGGK